MSLYDARPAFAAPRKSPAYYIAVRSLVSSLRDTASLKEIALHLNAAGMKTPSGNDWTRDAVSNFARAHSL